jgi:hypothetical protein
MATERIRDYVVFYRHQVEVLVPHYSEEPRFVGAFSCQ